MSLNSTRRGARFPTGHFARGSDQRVFRCVVVAALVVMFAPLAAAQTPKVEGRAVKVYCALCKQWFDGATHSCPAVKDLSPFDPGFIPIPVPEIQSREALNIYNRGVRTWNRGMEAWNRGAYDAAIADMDTSVADDRTALALEPNNADLARVLEASSATLRNARRYWKLVQTYREAVEKADLDEAIRILESALAASADAGEDGAVEAARTRALLQTLRGAREEQSVVRQQRLERTREAIGIARNIQKVFPATAIDPGPPDARADTFRLPRGDLIGSGSDAPDPSAPRTLFSKPDADAPPVDTRVTGPSRLDVGTSVPVPPRVHFRAALVPTIEPQERDRRRELLNPLDTERFYRLDQRAAVRLLIDREEAACDEANRVAVDEFTAEIARLFRTGLAREGDDLRRKEQEDPVFAKAVSDAMQRVKGREQQRCQRASAESMRMMRQYVRHEGARTADAQAAIDRVVVRLVGEQEWDLLSARRRAMEAVEAEMRTIVDDGLLDDVRSLDDFARKESTDAHFAERMKPVHAARDRLNQEGRRIRGETFQRLLGEVDRILKSPTQ